LAGNNVRYPLRSFDDDFQIARRLAEQTGTIADTTDLLADIARGCHAALLFGVDRVHWHADGRIDHYNCAQFVAADGALLGAYDKMHPVVFGEYVPLADRFPILYKLTPLAGGLKVERKAGERKKSRAFAIAQYLLRNGSSAADPRAGFSR